MPNSIKRLSLLFTASLFIAGCAGTAEKVESPAEIAIKEAVAANTKSKEMGYEWRDTGKLLKFAEKMYERGEEDKAVLLANKAKRHADIAIQQGEYEDTKYINSLSDEDRTALLGADEALARKQAEELKRAMEAQAKAAREAVEAEERARAAARAAEEERRMQQMSKQTVTTVSDAPSEVATTGNDSYTVIEGDSLWGIAGKDEIYSNSYAWPLIYKANRDKIEDADLIYPGQNFDIERGASQAEIDAAVNHARTRGAWSIGDVEQSDQDYLNR